MTSAGEGAEDASSGAVGSGIGVLCSCRGSILALGEAFTSIGGGSASCSLGTEGLFWGFAGGAGASVWTAGGAVLSGGKNYHNSRP
ncbi:MAG TPA: hypothetical protein PLU64_19825, partial [Saprospiraceae bacterium]|nr:hypothetical protein [Saprospiraceae bacterium]